MFLGKKITLIVEEWIVSVWSGSRYSSSSDEVMMDLKLEWNNADGKKWMDLRSVL